MADLFQIGLSGIRSSQASLATTGHNISNANTEGYSRQTVQVATGGADRYGSYFIGRGSLVTGIERAYDQFAFTENTMNTSQFGYAKEVYQQSSQLDMLLSGEGTSVTKPVLAAFDAMNGVTDSPNSLESRQVFLESTKNMVNQYNRLYDQLEVQYNSINNDIANTANTITTLADNIAEMNKQISTILGAGGDSNANDLLDQRDKAITELSELVNVSVVESGNGMLNVYMGSGQPVVMGSEAQKIIAVNGDPDPSRKELAINSNDKIINIDGKRLGGKVAAMFDTRNNDIERAFNQLGQNIIGLTHSVNEQQKQGQTLDGQIGDNLFNDVNAAETMKNRVMAHNDGLGDAGLSLRVDDLSQLTPDEYELVVNDYVAGPPESIEFNVTNKTTGKSQTLGPVDLSDTRRIDIPDSGLSLGIDSITAGNPPQAGKTFSLRPTRLAAKEVTLQETDPSKVAAADAEIKTLPADSNSGDATLRVSSLADRNDPLYMDADNPLKIVVTDNTDGQATFSLVDKNGKSAGSLLATPDPLSGKVTLSFAGIEVEMNGSPAVGDEFTFNYNETGSGDSRNITKMAGLQSQKIMNNNKATFQDVYSGMISEIGAKTANADVSMQSSAILKQQSFERIQSNSGVNMDEEAANLLMFQQHYSAAARVISVATELFDTILQAAR